jgi:hypothetical protein
MMASPTPIDTGGEMGTIRFGYSKSKIAIQHKCKSDRKETTRLPVGDPLVLEYCTTLFNTKRERVRECLVVDCLFVGFLVV